MAWVPTIHHADPVTEEQYITYQEFLPAMGVSLPKYTGYNPNVNSTLTNEFATVGYRAHTQIHGDGLEVDNVAASRYSAADIASLKAQGLDVQDNGDGTVSIDVPLGVMFFNPTLLKTLQLGPVLKSLESDPEYNNDLEIDNQLRSTLFQVPSSTDASCLNGPTLPDCFNVVNDLGAIDIQRNRPLPARSTTTRSRAAPRRSPERWVSRTPATSSSPAGRSSSVWPRASRS